MQYFLSIVYAEFQLFCFYKNSIKPEKVGS